MYDIERQQQIIDYLKEVKTASVSDLAKKFFASPSTIRRDLERLERSGVLSRTHGGAIYTDKTKEVSSLIRENVNMESKEKAVEVAIKNIPDFTTAFIDDSSTCLLLVKRLNFKNKTVTTNSLRVAQEVASRGGTVYLTGGLYSVEHMEVSGLLAMATLSRFHFDICLLSCAAFDADSTYEKNVSVSELKKLALLYSTKKILIVDDSKANTQCHLRTADLTYYDYIFTNIDYKLLDEYKKKYPNANIIIK